MQQKKHKSWVQNPKKYQKQIQDFGYPENEAIKSGFVYFAELSDRYSGPDILNQSTNGSSKKLIKQWENIFAKVKVVQRDREKKFIDEIENYVGKLTPDQQNILNQYKSGKPTTFEIVEKLTQFFQVVLVNEAVAEMLRNQIKIEDFSDAFDLAIKQTIPQIKEAVINESQAEAATTLLYNNMLNNLSLIIEKKGIPNFQSVKSKISSMENSLDLFVSLGLVRPNDYSGRKSQISQIVNNNINNKVLDLTVKTKKNKEKQFNTKSFTSSLSGIRDEFFSILAHEIEKNPNAKVKYLGGKPKEGQVEKQKTDIEIFLPSLNNIKQPPFKINISAKAASFAPDTKYIMPAKFAEPASLTERYKNIKDFVSLAGLPITSEDLNKLFYVINNEVIRNTKMLDIPQLLDILSYISFMWMFNTEDFQEINKQSFNSNVLNLFEIGGKIIPASVVFELMESNLKKYLSNNERLIQPRVYPAKKSIEYYYRTEANWQEIQNEMKEYNKRYAWEKMKSWTEDEGRMAFYLNSHQLYQILSLSKFT